MTSRRQFLANSVRVGALLGVGVPLLQACGGSTAGSRKVTKGIADGLSPEKGPLRIFNYADYVNPDLIAAFEKDFGVKVEITTFNSNSEALAKLASGAVKADIHHSMFPSSINRLIEGGLVQPLNKSYLPNFANVVPTFVDPWYDPKSTYSVPYMYFGSGIAYRADHIDPAQVEEQGWDTLWNATDFKGGSKSSEKAEAKTEPVDQPHPTADDPAPVAAGPARRLPSRWPRRQLRGSLRNMPPATTASPPPISV